MRRARSLSALLRAAAPCAPPAAPPCGGARHVSASAASRLNDRDGQFEELLERTLVRDTAA
jgi:hypothetical protein